jgi:hypothetical protein
MDEMFGVEGQSSVFRDHLLTFPRAATSGGPVLFVREPNTTVRSGALSRLTSCDSCNPYTTDQL